MKTSADRGTRRPFLSVPPPIRQIRQWRADEWRRALLHFIVLFFGLGLFSLGLVLNLQSNLGANAWTVFSDGVARRTPLTIGQANQVTGLVMIGASWLVGIRPGLGTVMNMYFIGLFMDLLLASGWIPMAEPYPLRVAMLLGSLLVLGLATGIYIRAGFGAGPRDSFNLALTRLTGLSVGVARWMIEVTVVVIGIILGGLFGPGTIIGAFLIGPAVGLGFRLTGLSPTGTQRVSDGHQEDEAAIMEPVEAVHD